MSTPNLTDAQGTILLGLVQGNASGTEPDFARVVDELVALDCAEWSDSLIALPIVLDAGVEALRAWLDPGTRAELEAEGLLEATT